jgi:hypothetical protein
MSGSLKTITVQVVDTLNILWALKQKESTLGRPHNFLLFVSEKISPPPEEPCTWSQKPEAELVANISNFVDHVNRPKCSCAGLGDLPKKVHYNKSMSIISI